MIALCRNKSIQIHLHENTSKLMMFIKNLQKMADNIRTIHISDSESPCERFNLARYRIHHNYTRAIVLAGNVGVGIQIRLLSR